MFKSQREESLIDAWHNEWRVKMSYSACGVSVHVVTKHPSINVSSSASSAVWVKTVVANSTGSQIPTDNK